MASSRAKNLAIIYAEVFISLILCLGRASCSGAKRCCSPGTVLTLKDGTYSCQLLSTSDESAVEFFERVDGNRRGLPQCKNGGNLRAVTFADFDNKNFNIRGDYCADILTGGTNRQVLQAGNQSGSPIVLICENSAQNFVRQDPPTLLNLRRCCPKGEIFYIKNRACLPSPRDEHRDISTLFFARNIGSSDFIHVVRGPPKCQHAIVDYEVNVSDVSIVAGRLQVTATSFNDVVDFLATEETVCLDVGSSPGLLVVRACRGVEFCRDNSCLRKCCLEDEAMVNNMCQKLPSDLTLSKWHGEVWNLPKITGNITKEIMNTTEYGLLVGNPCLYQMYPILPDEGWHIAVEGKVHVPGYKTYEHHEYCTDMFYNHSDMTDGFYPFICFEDPPVEPEADKARFKVNASLLSISCAFLLITLFVYICLPSLQNLHGKTLMCHVASLFLAFGCLAMVALGTPKEDSQIQDPEDTGTRAILCKFLGFMMLFAFLSAFFWLNVMCFDIWWKFGSLRHSGKTNTKRRDDFKRFISYCFYAWGLALGFVVIAVLADNLKFVPYHYRPVIGDDRCWFTTDKAVYGELIFFTGPVTVQLLVNLVFFILTARRCSMVKAEINRRVVSTRSDPRSRRFEADKAKFVLNVKLFVVMGISWVLEVISYFLSNYTQNIEWKSQFFYVSDGVNCLQGLLIFLLFVLKRKVLHELRRRFSKGSKRRASTGRILDPYRVRKSPSSSTILSTFAVSSSP